MAECLIAYGTNLPGPFGSSSQTILKALDELQLEGFVLIKKSRQYSSAAFPDKEKPRYLNGCIKVQAKMKPLEVLDRLKIIEKKMGRLTEQRWGSRVCDLDLLSFDNELYPNLKTFNYWMTLGLQDQIIEKPLGLLLPHPRIQDRAFVLKPLVDIAPNWRHPVLDLTAEEMLDSIPGVQKEDVVPI